VSLIELCSDRVKSEIRRREIDLIYRIHGFKLLIETVQAMVDTLA
jgi:hypothetical protein